MDDTISVRYQYRNIKHPAKDARLVHSGPNKLMIAILPKRLNRVNNFNDI